MRAVERFPDIERRNRLQQQLEVPALVHLLGLPLGQRVLEVGCGRGVALPVLAQLCRPRRLCGLDVDAALLDVAARRLRGHAADATLVCADLQAMPFEDASFDLVIDFGTCYYVPDREAALAEMERVLAPGGLMVYETLVSQVLSHPVRSRKHSLPWRTVPRLRPHRNALLWCARRKEAAAA